VVRRGIPALAHKGYATILRMPSTAALTSFFFEIAKDAFVAGLAAWLTVKRALREFSSQRWWERQEEAYRKIINSLSQIQVDLARMSTLGVEAVSRETQLQHWATVLENVGDLERIFHEGAFRISKASNIAVRDLTTTWYRAAPIGEGFEHEEMLDGYRARVDRCRKIIDAEARKDLGLPSQH
jgi:hypothetical protein